MASNYLIILVILSFIGVSLQSTSDNTVDESSPIADAISSVLQEQNGEVLGAMVQNFLQEQGGNILGNVLANLGKQNAGQILEGLGSVLANQDTNGKEEKGEADNLNIVNTLAALGNIVSTLQTEGGGGDNKKSSKDGEDNLNYLELLGNIAGSLQNTGGNEGGGLNAGSLLQGLGGLLGGGQNGQGGLDPSTIGNLVNMFTQNMQDDNKPNTQEQSRNMKPTKKLKKKNVPKKANEDDFDFGQLMTMAQSFLGGGKGKGSGEGFMQFLPMILQTISSFNGPVAEEREKSHSDHSWKLPPFLEKLHLGFDHLMNSEMGKYVIEVLGAEKSLKIFQNDKGEFDYQKFAEMMENRSFRRHWIKLVTERLINSLKYISQPEVYSQYLTSGQIFFNGFLKAQGFPKATFFDTKKPVDSISTFINYVAKKYLDMKIHSREYVQPIVEYVQELFILAQKKDSASSEYAEMADKLTDTINLELIEPLARVNRAYKFAKSVPKCTRYVLCLVNDNSNSDGENLPKMKRILYQGSSLLAAWYLSDDTDLPFWTLYTDITEPSYCKRLYSDICHGFHVEELKTSTEYVHSEL